MSKEKFEINPSRETEINEKNKKTEINETLQGNILDFIKELGFEQKETSNFERITEQWKDNYILYIVEQWSNLKLIKDWKESIIELPVESVIWESTFLQYFNWEKITSANASVEIKWKYLQVSFKNFITKFDKLSKEEQKKVISYFKELENQRKWKTKQVHPKN